MGVLQKMAGRVLTLFLACSISFFSGCQSGALKKKISAPIDSLMNLQQEAWNRGDIEGFMQWYWKSDSLCFISPSGITKGWNQTLARYQRSYPDKSSMGKLVFNNLSHQMISDSCAFTIGEWTLYRSSDTLSGHYSLLWKKSNENWAIVVDHTD